MSGTKRVDQRTEPATGPVPPAPVFYCTIDGAHPGPSGYNNLLRHMSGTCLEGLRSARVSLGERLVCGLLRRATLSGWIRGRSLLLECQVAWRKIRRSRPAISLVHAIWADRDLGYGDLFARFLGLRFFATFHACPQELRATARFPGRCRRLAGIVLMSSNQRAHFERSGVDPARLRVIHHGVDTDFFFPAENPPAGVFTVAFAGSYNRDFAQLRALIESMAGDQVRFRLLVPARITPLFAGLPHVDFFHSLSPAELRSFYQASHLLVMTVVDSTANNAILEAMACGLPVVADETGSSREYTGSAAGIIVAQGDVPGLRRAILALRENPVQREAMSRAARQQAETLAWPKVAKRLEQFYADMFELDSKK